MARTSNNFSIFARVELDTSTIQKQLNNALKGYKFTFDDKDLGKAAKGFNDIESASKSAKTGVEDFSLSFQAANEVFSKSIDVISSMVDKVYDLDGALTEFKKISDLSGSSLDAYVDKLADMGKQVARTGKPKCLSQNVGMINQH